MTCPGGQQRDAIPTPVKVRLTLQNAALLQHKSVVRVVFSIFETEQALVTIFFGKISHMFYSVLHEKRGQICWLAAGYASYTYSTQNLPPFTFHSYFNSNIESQWEQQTSTALRRGLVVRYKRCNMMTS